MPIVSSRASRLFHNSHIRFVATSEISQLRTKVIKYRISYFILCAYTTMTVLFDEPFSDYITRTDISTSSMELFSALLYVGWNFKPLYGFLADWFFPFHYPIKGYTIIISSLNIGLCLLGYILVTNTETDVYVQPFILFIIVMPIYLNLAFIDAICRKI